LELANFGLLSTIATKINEPLSKTHNIPSIRIKNFQFQQKQIELNTHQKNSKVEVNAIVQAIQTEIIQLKN
jgi:hypothetical protein